jgi:tRNA splicing endonuclease
MSKDNVVNFEDYTKEEDPYDEIELEILERLLLIGDNIIEVANDEIVFDEDIEFFSLEALMEEELDEFIAQGFEVDE